MSEKLKESLSAAVDGEADEFELLRVLDETGKDAELASSWERYHLIGSVMRRERVTLSATMGEAIWAEIQPDADASVANQPVVSIAEESPPAHKAGLGRWASLAVAVSVAVAVVIGFGDWTDAVGGDVPELARSGPTIEAQQEAIDRAVALNDEVTAVDQTRTDAYMVRHMQHRGMTQPGIGGFAKMVSYQKN